jgi:hypothetical protein
MGHKLRIVADSDATFALFQRLPVTGSTLERREAGGASLPPSAAAACDGQRGRSADEPAEQERTQPPYLGFAVHGSIEAWWCAPSAISSSTRS